ncbi:hypothetical protein ACFLR4_02845 [Bacteroidota bacterium]
MYLTKILSLLVIAVLLFGCGERVEKNGNWYYDESMKAYRAGDYEKFLDYTEKAVELLPGRITAQYNLACAHALNGKTGEAIATIENLIEKGMPVNIETDTDFDSIRDDERYSALIEKLTEARKPVNRSEEAFVIDEIDLIPEGLAYDSGEDCFYIGSLYKSKILKILLDGQISEFVSERQDSIVSIVGMKVDAAGRYLWASSSYGYKKDNIPFEELGTCEMVKFNLETGKLVDRYALPKEENHFFNDVVLNSDADAFVTDSHVPAVYLINHVENVVEEFAALETASYPNGIALSDNENILYVAVRSGIEIVDVKDKSVGKLKHPENIYVAGCDGLYFYKQSLIGVQGFLNRIVRFHLNDELNEVTEMEVLEAFNPEFENPTTGAIAGDYFYYIANAQLTKIDQEGKLFPRDQLNPVKIFKVKLESKEN